MMIDWIPSDEFPEEQDVYLVTWKGKLWIDAYMGFCEWDGERWVMEEFEPYKKWASENIIITAWAYAEPYKE